MRTIFIGRCGAQPIRDGSARRRARTLSGASTSRSVGMDARAVLPGHGSWAAASSQLSRISGSAPPAAFLRRLRAGPAGTTPLPHPGRVGPRRAWEALAPTKAHRSFSSSPGRRPRSKEAARIILSPHPVSGPGRPKEPPDGISDGEVISPGRLGVHLRSAARSGSSAGISAARTSMLGCRPIRTWPRSRRGPQTKTAGPDSRTLAQT